ncbi:MAG: DUF1926 domain-containing protein, partial [Deltaproteobacteria bacterium]|nr:DUF1926 domain-containing protein [Deltaproteobacteria bacterium]
PRGMWLAERIWEPQLPVCLKEAGMEYAVVDDYHFVKAGLRKEQLAGYYITEDMGNVLKIFPGSERLRYIIPFQTSDKFMENIRWVETLGTNPVAIFADDGEKFGTWPGTHQWVYKEGWLEKFLETIVKNPELIKPVTFSEYMDNNEPLGRVYLPTTSYMEMGEWTLPAEASETYTNLLNEVKTWPDGERIRRFLQGGFWRNLFAKYPEANWMHKRMLMVSETIAECGMRNAELESKLPTPNSQLRTYLYMAQCNDAYWHGVFGGLYLPHIRRAVYENLIKAENLLEERLKAEEKQAEGKSSSSNLQPDKEVLRPAFSLIRDFDADTFDEILVRTPELNLFLSPHNGGSIIELDYRPKAVNLSNTLSRWKEGYHHRVKAQGEGGHAGGTKSIHDLTMSKEEGLEKYLFFDKEQRLSLRDHFLKKEETLDAFRKSAHEEMGDFAYRPYENNKGQVARGKGQVIFSRDGKVNGQAVLVEKKISVKDNGIIIDYCVKRNSQLPTPSSQLPLRFGIEFNLILPCCDGMDGFYDISIEDKGLGGSGEIVGIRQIGLVDKWTKMRVDFGFDRDTSLWRFPVETVSISEAGFERNFQGSCILFFWDISMDKSFEVGFKVKVEAI